MSSFFRAVSTTADILEWGGVFSNQVINVIEKDGPICNDSKFQFFQKMYSRIRRLFNRLVSGFTILELQ